MSSADVFVPRRLRGLGHHIARTYVAIQESSDSVTAAVLGEVTGYTFETIGRHLAALTRYRLVKQSRDGAWRVDRRSLTAVAKELGCYGAMAMRARRYAAEQAVYAWWCDELAWMRAPRRGVRTGPRTVVDQVVLPINRPSRRDHRYPRDRAGRADHQAALSVLDLTRRPAKVLKPAVVPATKAKGIEQAAIKLLSNVLGATPLAPAG